MYVKFIVQWDGLTGIAATDLPPLLRYQALCAPPFSSVRHLQRRLVSSDNKDLC
jgi:hypothetical protein